MTLTQLLTDKITNSKEKTIKLSESILNNSIQAKEVIEYAKKAKAADKGTCVEAFEFASKQSPQIITKEVFEFICECLADKAPRVQWESAKVIGNVASLLQPNFKKCIPLLLTNSEQGGTVVRWSAAYALSEIIKTQHASTKDLVPVVKSIISREEKNSIRKIYEAALKKIQVK